MSKNQGFLGMRNCGQFSMMKEFDAKVEIQSLSSKGISFISEKYLPEKIKDKDWIE